jgi:hypothetical protein
MTMAVTMSLKRFLASTTGWAMIFCLLGAGAIFMPWAEARQFRGPLDAEGVFQSMGAGFPETIYATRLWHGYPTTFLFLGLFLFLFITRRINGVPLWQSLVLVTVPVGISVLLLIGREYHHAAFASDEVAGKLVPGMKSAFAIGNSFSCRNTGGGISPILAERKLENRLRAA